jgi:hypothetical protein
MNFTKRALSENEFKEKYKILNYFVDIGNF